MSATHVKPPHRQKPAHHRHTTTAPPPAATTGYHRHHRGARDGGTGATTIYHLGDEVAAWVAEVNTDQRGRSWALPLEAGVSAVVPVWNGRTAWLSEVHQALTSDNTPTGGTVTTNTTATTSARGATTTPTTTATVRTGGATPATTTVTGVAPTTGGGVGVTRRHRTSTATVTAVAQVLAEFACSRTGRRVSASTATIAARAGVSMVSVQRARRVLRDLGLAREMVRGRHLTRTERLAATAHHGGTQIAAGSLWHLTQPRPPIADPGTDLVAAHRARARRGRTAVSRRRPHRTAAHRPGCTAAPARRRAGASTPAASATTPPTPAPDPVVTEAGVPPGCDDLSCTPRVQDLSPVGSCSPTRASAHGPDTDTTTLTAAVVGCSCRRTPRPLALQQLAAALVSRCQGMDRGQWLPATPGTYVRLPGWHIGQVCDVLVEAGIDPQRWSARAITDRLDRRTREQASSWPNRLTRPVAFLRHQLLSLDWSAPHPPRAPRAAAVGQATRSSTLSGEVVEGISNRAYLQWRAAMDARHPHLAKPGVAAGLPVMVSTH
ncbi:hypothetical protein ACIGO9_29655 [Nocardia asteroides]|uniref:hypothetical protein n=1 Tax=Nocardia asteroides TaxID=1824 RepID=UPI0037C555B2